MLPCAAILLLALALYLTAPMDGSFWWSDAPRHALNGIFLKDALLAAPFAHPARFAMDYYVQYPALTILFYPPLLYCISAPFFLLFGDSHATAQAVIALHGLALGCGMYALARHWMDRWAALATALLLLGLPPRGPEVARGIAFLLVAIAYGGVWLAVAMLFSVIFRSTATSALCALGLWLFFFILWPMIASAITTGFTPAQFQSVDQVLSLEQLSSALARLSPGTLFGEAVLGLLNPETKAFGYFANLVMAQTRGMIPGTPLPLDQSLLLIWPQITGLIAGMIVLFAIAYIVFQREEVRA